MSSRKKDWNLAEAKVSHPKLHQFREGLLLLEPEEQIRYLFQYCESLFSLNEALQDKNFALSTLLKVRGPIDYM